MASAPYVPGQSALRTDPRPSTFLGAEIRRRPPSQMSVQRTRAAPRASSASLPAPPGPPLPQATHSDLAFSTRALVSSSAIGSVVTAASAVALQRRSREQTHETPQRHVREGEPQASPGRNVQQPQASPAGRSIQIIATDVDGTLLDSQQRLSDRTELALRLAQEQGVQVVLATGKARGPWVPEILERLQLDTPGVFMQGLMVYSADGTLLYERTLDDDLAQEIAGVAESRDITLVAYCGERILCAKTDEHTERLIGYGEPIPEAVGPLSEAVGTVPVHKMLFMSDDSSLSVLRRQLEVRLAGRATLVTALPGMLEVLPLGASKAAGLMRVLEVLGVPEGAVMAAGDGENDVEMLKMVGFSVAMGNASSQVKSHAHYISTSNDQDGLAHAVERFVLKPGFWCWD